MKNAKLIRAGWLIDGSGGPIRQDMLLHVENGSVCSVREFQPDDRKNPAISDLSDYTVLPGLIDAHLHLFMSGTGDQAVRQKQLNAEFEDIKPVISDHLKQLLAHGVIAVRDGGDYGRHAQRYKQECLDTGHTPVRIRVAGKAWRKPGRYGKLIGRPPSDGQSLADAIAGETAPIDHVKIVNSGLNSLSEFGKETPPQFGLEEFQAGVEAAHKRGLKVMVHCNGRLPVEIAVRAGCDSVEHGFFMGEDNLKRMADARTVWVPTAITMKAYSEQLKSDSPEAGIARRNFEHQLKQIIRARESGVRIALGTDAGSLGVHHGSGVIEEFRILMTAGFSVQEAVCCAASNGAELLGLKELGRIAPGKTARFIAVKGTPTDLPDSLKTAELFSRL